MLIPNKHNGYSGGVRRLCRPDDDSGGGPTAQETETTDLPEWRRKYAKNVLAQGAALTNISQNPYQTYDANRIADFSPMQYRSFQGANDMRPSTTTEDAAVMAGQAGLAAYGTNYKPGQFSNQFTAPEQFSPGNIKAPSLTNYQMRGPADVQSQQFGQQAAEQYMSPYMQSVVDVQQREAQRQADISKTQRNAQAVGAGAYGGSRQAIMDAEAARNLATQKGDIQAQGLQSAYGQAQQQYNADQAQRMQAALANQGMGYNVGSQNLQANLGVQQLGANQNLQAQQANEQSRQFGSGQNLQAAGLAAQYGQSAQQLGEQSRQYGAGLGMQGLQTGLQAAGQLGQLGGQQFQQGMDINKLQNVYGGQMQQQAQRPLDQAYQDFLNQQNYPYKQLGFMSDLVNSGPVGQQSTRSIYEAPGNTFGQTVGLGLNTYGALKAGGGMVHDYAEGGVTSDQNVEGILSKLSDEQLQQAKQGALARRDVEQVNMIDAEMSMRASARNGIGAGISPEFADQMEESMAGGGIVAFADKGAVEDKDKKYGSVIGKEIMEGLSGFFGQFNPSTSGYSEEVGQTPEAAVERSKVLQQTAKEAPAPRVAAPSAAPARKTDVVERSVEKPRGDESFKQPAPQAAARNPEASFSGPKPSKAEVKSAVAQFAEQRGATSSEKEGYLATALKLRDELGKQDQPILDRLNAAIEAQKPDEKAIKDRGFNQAISQFGAALAERASRPGATFLGSAAGASPAFASAIEKTNNLIDAKKENYTKMQLDQAKYELALSQGKMQTAATLAGQIRQAQQQDQMLELNIAKAKDDFALKNRELAQSGAHQSQMASRYETIGSLTRDIMQNERLPYDKAIEKAGRLMKPAGYAADVRAGTALNANLDKALKDIDAKDKYRFLSILKPDNPRYGPMRAEYEAEVRDAHTRYGGDGGQNPPPVVRSRLPSGVTVTEVGR